MSNLFDSCDTEEWRPVSGYEGLYEVSNFGRVRSLPHMQRGGRGNPLRSYGGKYLKSVTPRGGYPRVSLSKGGIVREDSIHVLVCTAFHGPKPVDKDLVAHSDGDPSNANARNLRWATFKENEADKLRHGRRPLGEEVHGSKLIPEIVTKIRAQHGSCGEIAEKFGVSKSTIWEIRTGHTWAHLNGAPVPVPRRRRVKQQSYQAECTIAPPPL